MPISNPGIQPIHFGQNLEYFIEIDYQSQGPKYHFTGELIGFF